MSNIRILLNDEMQYRGYHNAVIDFDEWAVYVTDHDYATGDKVTHIFPKEIVKRITIRDDVGEEKKND